MLNGGQLLMRITLSTLALLITVCAVAQEFPESEVSFERIYSWPLIYGRSPADVQVSNDGTQVCFRWNRTGERRRELFAMRLPDGEPIQLTDCTKIKRMPWQDDDRKDRDKEDDEKYDAGPSGGLWSPDGKEILFNYRGDMFVVPPDGSAEPRRLLMSRDHEGGAQYSPDGKYISFMHGGNVWLYERATGFIRQLTTISKAHTSVGGYEWSPTSKHLLVTWSTSEHEKQIIITDYTTEFVETHTVRRGYVGTNPYRQKIGVIGVDEDEVRWVEGVAENAWNYGTDWSPDGTRIALSDMHPDFKGWTLRVIDITRDTLKAVSVQEQTTDKQYMNDWRPVRWSLDGRWIYYGADLDGWRHIWKTNPFGGTPLQVTKGEFDVLDFQRPKESDVIYYTSTEIDPQQMDLYALYPDGHKVKLSVLTGMNSASVDDRGDTLVVTAHDQFNPPEIYYMDPTRPEPRRLTYSPLPEFKKVKLVEPQRVTFVNESDGKTIHALIYVPPDLKPGEKRPAFLSGIYAGSAKMGWAGLFDHYACAELGFVVMRVDFRASWGYGSEFETGYYNSMGVIDADEAASAAKYLRSLPYVDGDHLGLWGWSYGGFLTEMVMFTRPDAFQVGVAVAPVTDWKNYNHWYTLHRLDDPKDNEENYEKTSPLYHAEGLKGKLLMIHGMQDGNVLFQETVKMVQALIEAGKEFDVMFYPRDDHGISREESWMHVHRKVIKYFMRWLADVR
jgi:dipeptidyl-peptidase-4